MHEQDRSTSFYQQPVSCLPSCRRSRLTRAVTQPASGAHVTCTSSLHLFIADFIVSSLLSFLRIQEDFIPLSSASSPAGCGKSLSNSFFSSVKTFDPSCENYFRLLCFSLASQHPVGTDKAGIHYLHFLKAFLKPKEKEFMAWIKFGRSTMGFHLTTDSR